MAIQEQAPGAIPAGGEEPREKTKGEVYEGLAFTFCKAGTLVLLTGKFALPVISGGAAVLYLLAYYHGQRDSRCVLRRPLLIAGFWAVVCLVWLTQPLWIPALAHALGVTASAAN